MILNYKYITIILFIVFSQSLYAQEANSWDVDISQCIRVNERFFVNGIENKINSPINYYDVNGNHVLRILYNQNGQERHRSIKIYNEQNEMIEYSHWDVSGSSQWRCWNHGIVEKIFQDDKVIYLTSERSYFEDYKLIKETIYDVNGNLISVNEIDPDGFISYKEYNDKNDLVFYRFSNEKSNGIREEIYEIEYDNNLNKIRIKTIENGVLKKEIINVFNENNLLIQSIFNNYINDFLAKCFYLYDENNNLIEEKHLDKNNNEIFIRYFQYDSQGRVIKSGEKDNDFERYRIYEYSMEFTSERNRLIGIQFEIEN